ncbi:MAG: hypothetical protein BAA02_01445 [Paenibacillaceae bacterium ZCTH02-B3]|nr:MAG: hypothetical protein BAA02_01445 [Paenibacillaceae bacterium ZCTH02-B3]
MSPTTHLWWILLLFAVILAVLAAFIAYLLWSLAKRGDERSVMIRTKAMSAAFIGTVALLALETVRWTASKETGTNPLLLLVIVAFIFFAALVIYKRKYGDLG